MGGAQADAPCDITSRREPPSGSRVALDASYLDDVPLLIIASDAETLMAKSVAVSVAARNAAYRYTLSANSAACKTDLTPIFVGPRSRRVGVRTRSSWCHLQPTSP